MNQRTHITRICSVTILIAVGQPAPVHAEPLVWPTRSEALPPDTYITTSGHSGDTNAIDFSALRWDSGTGEYSIWKANATAPLTVDDHVGFGIPLFAPEDGYVVACFHNHPDEQDPAVDQCADVDGDDDPDCPPGLNFGGNFIMIVAADGDHAITLAHLKEDSIPPGLCPNASTPPVSGAKSSCISGMDAIRNEFRLDIQNPGQPYPLVAKGDLVGRMGHNGNSSGPHTHVQWKPFAFDPSGNPCEGPSEPIEWFEGYRQDRTPGVAPTSSWTQMDGHEIVDGDRQLIWPDPIGWAFTPLSFPHDASNLHLFTSGPGGVGAYMDASDNLDIRTWTVSTTGAVTNQDLHEDGAVQDVALAGPIAGSRDVVAVIRGSNGDLRLIPYDVDGSGNITRLYGKEEDGGPVSQVAAVKSPTHGGVVVAVKDSIGNLEVLDYTSDLSLNLTKELAEGSGAAIRDVAVTSGAAYGGVVTAELKQSNGELIIRSFEVPPSGGVFNDDSYSSGVFADAVDIDTVPVGFGEQFVTSVQLTSGLLRLDTWDVDVAGAITHGESVTTDGTISALSGTSGGNGDFLTAIVDSTDHARLISWEIRGDGKIRRSGTRLGRATTELAVMRANDAVGHVSLLYTDENAALRLRIYDRNYDSDI